jgi:hypothetical protein
MAVALFFAIATVDQYLKKINGGKDNFFSSADKSNKQKRILPEAVSIVIIAGS